MERHIVGSGTTKFVGKNSRITRILSLRTYEPRDALLTTP